jgi:hypothetical protein
MKRGRRVFSDGTESDLERLFLSHWMRRYPRMPPSNNYPFHLSRNWRFDFAWITHKVAVEIQGMGPGHCSLSGMTKDYDKHMGALLDNWKVVYLTTTHLLPENEEGTCSIIARLLGIWQPPTNTYTPLRKR